MTVIIGINLSHRSLLAGDTRLSYEQDGNIYVRHDNMQKVEDIGGQPSITVACAGNAHFARYVIERLKQDAVLDGGITAFKAAARECIGLIAHDYFSQFGYEGAEVTLIFAGSDTQRHKIVEGQQFIDMANAYTSNGQGKGRGAIRVNSALQETFPVGKKIEPGERTLSINNTDIFAAEITHSRLNITETQWGQLLIYGPEGLVRSDIEPKDIAFFEFGVETFNNGTGVGNDFALMTAFIHSQATKYKLSAVGGSVVVFENNFDGSSRALDGKVLTADKPQIVKNGPRFQQVRPELINSIDARDPSQLYREEHGTRYKLKPISKYQQTGIENMLL
jgi:hypothetical protein